MSIDKYLENNRITCNVYGVHDELLIGVGTPINNNIRKRLDHQEWRVEEPSEYVYDNIALINDDLTPIIPEEGIDSELLIEKAKQIVEIILNNPIVFTSLSRIKKYDDYTYNHCNEVACLAVAMGIRMNLSTHDLINIAIASLTHDIGKCIIDKKIINKPGKLTNAEYEEVKKHSLYGYEMMKRCPQIDQDVAKIILYHHENYDGTGYPMGLKGDEIPLSSSIIHVCDVFDALVSERPYKKRLSEFDSVNILKTDSGTKFDPRAIEIFSSSLLIYGIGSILELPTGKKIEIVNILKDESNNVVQVKFKEVSSSNVYVRKL